MRQAGRKIFMLLIFIDTRKEDVLIKPSHKVIITNCNYKATNKAANVPKIDIFLQAYATIDLQ